MNFTTAIKTCFQKYFDFSGRARRSEYWWFILFTIILSVVTAIMAGLIFGWETTDSTGPFNAITSLAVFFPPLAVGFRRLHDTNRSGWWLGAWYLAIIAFAIIILFIAFTSAVAAETGMAIFIGLLAIVFLLGLFAWGIALIVFYCSDSDQGDNKYGPSPKYDRGADVFD